MLEKIVNTINLSNFFIPEDELKFFTKEKSLFDYQVDALKKTLKFFELSFERGEFNKEKLYQKYLEFDESLSNLKIKDSLIGEEKFSYLYLGKEQKEIEFKDLINRCSYWMATGSGKTLIMVKLVYLLKKLIKAKKIPNKKILILAPSNAIIEQIKAHFEEFNKANSEKLQLKDLREFNEYDDLYIYRADNIVASESKENLLNFYDFWNDGEWYLILDEAHKGDKDESIRQKLFALIAKNGIMFNFSATFTEEIDKVTTIKDFKLDKFLNAGYGKKIALLDFSVVTGSDEQKNSIVKSLILLAALKKEYRKLKPLYSAPLMLVLANSVNIEKADLKEYFKNLQKIVAGDFDFKKAKDELVEELTKKKYLFGLGEIKIETLKEINESDFYRVFNVTKPSRDKIEVSRLLGNSDELIFKLKGSSEYFMLINASNINKWTNDFLDGYEIVESIEESVFKNLDVKENISILMGSRKFIEGWDSNRPSIINFVNLGTTKEAKKLILQAVGRGVRIEPFRNFRKRLCDVEHNEEEIKLINEKLNKLKVNPIELCKNVNLIESLFIFPSKKEQVEKVLLSLKEVSDNLEKECRKINVKKQEIDGLCYPVFKESDEFNDEPFIISKDDFDRLEKLTSKYDEVTLLLKFGISVRSVRRIKDEKSFRVRNKKGLNLEDYELLRVIDNYFNKKVKKFAGFEIVNDEVIKHYKHICAEMSEEDIKEFQEDIDKIIEAKKCPENTENKLEEIKNKILQTDDIDEIIRLKEEAKRLENEIKSKFIPDIVECKMLLEHYYIPILHLRYEKEVIEKVKFKHIIKVGSEIEFLNELIKVIPKMNEKYDSWYFSKLDESLDEIKIPYFNTDKGDWDNFSPDFIFWLKEGNRRKIIFVDPKGVEHTRNARDKIEGFERFVKNINEPFVEVKLFLYNKEAQNVDSEKKEYWVDELEKIFELN